MESQVKMLIEDEDGDWCEICGLTKYMANLGWCDKQKELRAQKKECPKLMQEEEKHERFKPKVYTY